MKVNKRKLTIWLCVAALLVIWLLISNFIIGRFFDGPIAKEYAINNNDYTDRATFNVENITYNGTLAEKVSITGWLFGEGPQDSNRTVSAVLRGLKSGKCYELPHVPFDEVFYDDTWTLRTDVVANNSDKNLEPGRILGFKIEADTFNMKKDVYELLLYYRESATESGIVKTGIYVNKDKKSIGRIWDVLGKSDVSVKNSEYEANSNIEATVVGGDTVRMVGWAFIDNMDTHTQNVLVELSSSDSGSDVTYMCMSELRDDVSVFFNDERYKWSGFNAYLPRDRLEIGRYKVRIIAENNGCIAFSDYYDLVIE